MDKTKITKIYSLFNSLSTENKFDCTTQTLFLIYIFFNNLMFKFDCFKFVWFSTPSISYCSNAVFYQIEFT